MEKPGLKPHVALFGPFEADLSSGLLTRKGMRIKLGVQPFQVLALLLSRPGQIVTREEICSELWPNGTYVDFEGSLNSALKKLRAALDDDPKDFRFIETVPKRGYRFIMPVTLVDVSAAKGKKASAQLQIPAGHAPATLQRRILGRHGMWLRWRFVALGSFALVIATMASMIALDRTTSTLPSAHAAAQLIPSRASIAVLGFRNVSGGAGHEWMATALSEMLGTELAGGGKLRLVPAEDVANLRHSSPWPQTGSLDPKTTSRIGYALDCDFLVLGSYTTIGTPGHSQLRIDARVQDAMTGKILTETAAGGNEMSLFQIVSELGAGLRKGLNVPAPNESDELGLMASMPLDPVTARFYSLGLEKLRAFDPSAAKDLLIQATRSDPKFSLAHAMLARAWSSLGYEQKRRAEIKKALQLSKDLPRTEQMMVEGDYYDSLGNHEKAASVYRALFELYPDDLDFGLQLATEQRLAGRGSRSRETLQRLRQLPLPASQDPRIDLAAAWLVKNKAEELRLERNAMKKALSQGKTLIYADAKRRECLTLNYTEHPADASASCKEAYSLFMAAGNRASAADAVRILADNQGTLNHADLALATYQRALRILHGTGELDKTGAILNNMAILFANRGQLDRAQRMDEEAENDFKQAGDRRNEVTAMANLGDVRYLRGDLNGAASYYEFCLRAASQLDPSDPGYALTRLADVELKEGQVSEARRDAEAALNSFPPSDGGFQYSTSAMIELGLVLEAQGDLSGAAGHFEKALEIRQKLGAQEGVGESKEMLGHLELREGHPDQAESLARGAIADFEKVKATSDLSSVYTLLGRALLAEGRLEAARGAIQQAKEYSGQSSDPDLRLPIKIEEARVRLAQAFSGSFTPSDLHAPRLQLQGVISTARHLGYYGIECEARLALGEMDMKLNPASGRAFLAKLATDAHRRGMNLISREAVALQNDSRSAAASMPHGLRASSAHP